jgi:hypothetical protein
MGVIIPLTSIIIIGGTVNITQRVFQAPLWNLLAPTKQFAAEDYATTLFGLPLEINTQGISTHEKKTVCYRGGCCGRCCGL